MARIAYIADRVFDGAATHDGVALLVDGAEVAGIVAEPDIPADSEAVRLGPGTLAPGFVDLQVNGGGGVMFNDDPSVGTLARIAEAHASRGTTAFLATLITDTRERMVAAIDAVEQAVADGVAGLAGLHLEGPHLSVARKGAHEAALIRPMLADDLDLLRDAAARLPLLMVTVAPETVGPEQIAALSQAGVIVSLGHSDADFDTCSKAADSGARCTTHLFNAMSQLGNRDPGLVGATLADGGLSAGLIADGIHVHPAAIRAAVRAKTGPGEIVLVTDAMATIGSDITEFTLNRRLIRRHRDLQNGDRQNGDRLTLADGTLAGAHLDMPRALAVMTGDVGLPLEQALMMATAGPARVLDRYPVLGALTPGGRADFVHLDASLTLRGTWAGGRPVA